MRTLAIAALIFASACSEAVPGIGPLDSGAAVDTGGSPALEDDAHTPADEVHDGLRREESTSVAELTEAGAD